MDFNALFNAQLQTLKMRAIIAFLRNLSASAVSFHAP